MSLLAASVAKLRFTARQLGFQAIDLLQPSGTWTFSSDLRRPDVVPYLPNPLVNKRSPPYEPLRSRILLRGSDNPLDSNNDKLILCFYASHVFDHALSYSS